LRRWHGFHRSVAGYSLEEAEQEIRNGVRAGKNAAKRRRRRRKKKRPS